MEMKLKKREERHANENEQKTTLYIFIQYNLIILHLIYITLCKA